MPGAIYIILVIIVIIASIILLVMAQKEEKKFFLSCVLNCCLVISVIFLPLLGDAKGEGKVLQVCRIQNSCVQSLNEKGEFVFVPTYLYLIIFEADDGEYRTYATFEDNYKEGDIIIYKYNETKSITIND